ncbi:MAG: radical SAM protein [Calditrichaeota bacterium]|nr:MAG: radical SAM protein [Calditrichota bacterium]MBL1206644.1 radical SAM protein [Calditrichota bacterium]NOG46471.1 B12-binding domain-containing radical SAM protein [Calditrichota bacterium]
MSKILFFNPRSANHSHRIPNSILQIAASIEGKFDYAIVDGNLENDPWKKIQKYLASGNFKYFGCTVMPGPQLKQAIPFSKKIRDLFPSIKIIWGGYFPANQPDAVLYSGFVDFIINGPGDTAFPELLSAIEDGLEIGKIPNLIYKSENKIIRTAKAALPQMDDLPSLPYEKLNHFYPMEKYLGKTFLGKKTIAYHSSFGCPFTCSFCAVVPIYNARWQGKSAKNIFKDIKYLKNEYGADAIEFHDNNFFVSEERAVEFAQLIKNENMHWWGEARIDTMDKYSDESLKIISEAGCRMIFFGAESGNDEVLKQMNKGGKQTANQIIKFAARLKKFNIIPEYSFVLGLPAENEQKVWQQIKADVSFIKNVKKANPNTEIIIYLYSPVPNENSELFKEVQSAGFEFPNSLEDWINPHWENFDLRKNPLTPWLKPYMIDYIQNFEAVLNAYSPTVSDFRLTSSKRKLLKLISFLRYKANIYKMPYEIKLLFRLWKYRQPEIEGFYAK